MNKNLLFAIITIPVIAVIVWVVVSSSKSETFTPNKNDKSSNENVQEERGTCVGKIEVSNVSVDKDPTGDTEAWVKFDYMSSASNDLICAYTITILNGQNELVREIKTEDSFTSPSGIISNGYSSTPFVAGMTAKIEFE